MHAVLHLQADGPDAQNHQPLKQRLGQARLGRLLTHHHRPQLTVVSHQDQLKGGETEKLDVDKLWGNVESGKSFTAAPFFLEVCNVICLSI